MNGKSMTSGTPWKLILAFTLPVLAGTLLQQLYNTVDTIIVGNFAGEDPLSAVGTTGSFGFLFLALAVGFSTGCGVLVAHHYGAENEKMVRENASTGILLMLGMGLLSTVLGIILCRPVFGGWMAEPAELLDISVKYFVIYAAGMIFQFGYNIIASILRAIGDSKATLYFLLIASLLNIVLDLLFVAVFRWGAPGAAAATDIAQAASFAAAYFYMNKKYPVFRFKISEYRFKTIHASNILKVGFPMALQLVLVSFGFTFIQRAVNSYGKPMIASFTVAQRMETYMNMPATSFQTAMATYTGQNLGAGKPERIKQGVKQTVIMSFLITVLISVVVIILAGPITGLFGIGGQSMDYCVRHLRATAVCMLIISTYFPLFGVFQGSGHGGAATLVAACALTVRVITTYTLCNIPQMDYRIIWWNQLFGFMVGCTVAWTYYKIGAWKKQSRSVSA